MKKFEVNSLTQWVAAQDVVGLLVPSFIIAAEFDISRQRLRALHDNGTLTEWRVFNVWCLSLREFRNWHKARSGRAGRPRKMVVNAATISCARDVTRQRPARNFLHDARAAK